MQRADGQYVYWVLESKVLQASAFDDPEGALNPVGPMVSWTRNDWHRISDSLPVSHDITEGRNDCHRNTGEYGWHRLDVAQRVLEIARSTEHPYKDGHGRICQRFVEEFRLVRVEVTQRSQVVEEGETDEAKG